ncbi:MAG: hypothetical protein ACRDD2_02255 [Sarcina sp.]
MREYTEVIITARELKGSKVVRRTIILTRSKEVLFSGKVIDKNKKPLSNVIIMIKEIYIECSKECIKNRKYVVTNEDGEYAVLLRQCKGINYKIELFEPAINS